MTSVARTSCVNANIVIVFGSFIEQYHFKNINLPKTSKHAYFNEFNAYVWCLQCNHCQITTKCCTWYDRYAVIEWRSCYSNMMTTNRINANEISLDFQFWTINHKWNWIHSPDQNMVTIIKVLIPRFSKVPWEAMEAYIWLNQCIVM